jgi:hypothetical protein
MKTIEFDEEFYLLANPDVRKAITEGIIGSAKEHFERFGKAEGRPGVSVVHTEATARSLHALEITPELMAAAERNGSAMHVSSALSPSDFILKYIIKNSAESVKYGVEGGVFQRTSLQVRMMLGKFQSLLNHLV